jgi:excisionase family DNA binding protein
MSRYEPPSRQETRQEPRQDGEFEPFSDFSGPIQPPADSERRVLSVSEVAKYCGVPSEEVLNWIDTGRLVATYMGHGGYRIAVGDFLAFFSRYTFLI